MKKGLLLILILSLVFSGYCQQKKGTFNLSKPVGKSDIFHCIHIGNRHVNDTDTISASVFIAAGKLEIEKDCSPLTGVVSFDAFSLFNGGEALWHSVGNSLSPPMLNILRNIPNGDVFYIQNIICSTKDSNVQLRGVLVLRIKSPIILSNSSTVTNVALTDTSVFAAVAGRAGGNIRKKDLLASTHVDMQKAGSTINISYFEMYVQSNNKTRYAYGVSPPTTLDSAKDANFTPSMISRIKKAPKGSTVTISRLKYQISGGPQMEYYKSISLVLQ
jgi:hypothetical protein